MKPPSKAAGPKSPKPRGMAKPKSKPQEPKQERKAVDWERIEVEFRAGQLSVSEVGRIHGLSHTAINKRAKREGWIRDLADRVRKEVSARLVSDGVSTATQRETITECAERVVQIVREHRNDIKDGREILVELYAELKEVTASRDEIEETIKAEEKDAKRRAAMLRAVSLPSRAGTALSLSTALKI